MLGLVTSVISSATVMAMMSGPVDYNKPPEPTLAVIVVDAYKRMVGSIFGKLDEVIIKLDKMDKRMDDMATASPRSMPMVMMSPQLRELEPRTEVATNATVIGKLDKMTVSNLARLRSGKYTNKDVAAVIVAYKTKGDWEGLGRFCKEFQSERLTWPLDRGHMGFQMWYDRECARGK